MPVATISSLRQAAVYQGYIRLEVGDVGPFQQLHARIGVFEGLVALADVVALTGADAEHHLRHAMHDLVALARRQFGGVIDHHRRRALDLQRFVQRVIGLDVAAVDGLAVVVGVGVHLRRAVVFLDQQQTFEVRVASQFVKQCGAADTAADDNAVIPGRGCHDGTSPQADAREFAKAAAAASRSLV